MLSYLKHQLFDDILSIAYPKVCLGCRKIEPVGEKVLCIACNAELSQIENKSDVYAALIGKEYLIDFKDDVYSLLYFQKDNLSQELLHQIKYYGKSKLAVYLGRKLANHYSEELKENDILVPVPLHPRKFRERGFNQAEKIAEGIKAETGLPIRNDLLKRILYRASQTQKTQKEREEVLKETYRIIPTSRKPAQEQRIILVDDVITTGSTIRACIDQLESVNITNYAVISLAISL